MLHNISGSLGNDSWKKCLDSPLHIPPTLKVPKTGSPSPQSTTEEGCQQENCHVTNVHFLKRALWDLAEANDSLPDLYFWKTKLTSHQHLDFLPCGTPPCTLPCVVNSTLIVQTRRSRSRDGKYHFQELVP